MPSCVWYNSSHTLSSSSKNVFYTIGNTQGRRKQSLNGQAKVEVDFVLVSNEDAHLQYKMLSKILGGVWGTLTGKALKGISWKYTDERTEVYPTSYATAKIALSGWHCQSETFIRHICTLGAQESFLWHFGLCTVRVVITYHHYNNCHRCHWDSRPCVCCTGYLSSGGKNNLGMRLAEIKFQSNLDWLHRFVRPWYNPNLRTLSKFSSVNYWEIQQIQRTMK